MKGEIDTFAEPAQTPAEMIGILQSSWRTLAESLTSQTHPGTLNILTGTGIQETSRLPNRGVGHNVCEIMTGATPGFLVVYSVRGSI